MRVYHLLSFENGVSNLALQRMRVSRFSDLNDPFELLAANLKDGGFRRVLRAWKKEFDQVNGLLCFSKQWKNPVLWSDLPGFSVHS